MAKYQPLARYLAAQQAFSLALSFSDIEHIIGARLPPSARTRREWWWNDRNVTSSTHVQCHAWVKGRYKVQTVDFAMERVTFRKIEATSGTVPPRDGDRPDRDKSFARKNEEKKIIRS